MLFMANYKTLDVWKFSMQLVSEVYLLIKKYPKEELFALTSQTKRATISIPSNIAEGLGRQYKKDSLQFMHIARGSAYELETHLQIAIITGLINETELTSIQPLLETVFKLLNSLINAYETRQDLK
jgi:four helix bundle protein